MLSSPILTFYTVFLHPFVGHPSLRLPSCDLIAELILSSLSNPLKPT